MLYVIFILILVGVGLYLVNRLPMDANIRTILNALVVLLVILWLLQVFGVFAYLGSPSIPRLHR